MTRIDWLIDWWARIEPKVETTSIKDAWLGLTLSVTQKEKELAAPVKSSFVLF